MFMAHVEFVSEHPGVPRMLFGELQRAELTAPKRMAQTLIHRYGEHLESSPRKGRRRVNCRPPWIQKPQPHSL